MSLDPATVRIEELEKVDLLTVPASIVARYDRAVVVEVLYPGATGTSMRFTVYALSSVDGPYEKPVILRAMSEDMAHDIARGWTRVAQQGGH